MVLFGLKPEPGERVLLRDTALRDPLLLYILALAGVFVFRPDLDSLGAEAVLRVLVVVAVPCGLYLGMAVLISRALKAGWAITDRRVVAWRGVLRKKVEAARRDEIDGTALDGDDLLVHIADRTMRLDLKGIRDGTLQDALGESAPPAGLRAEALNRVLKAGETLAWRHPPLWKRALPAAAALLLAVVLSFWAGIWLGWIGTPARPIDLLRGAEGLLLLPLLVTLYRNAAWSAAVTAKRVLLRRLHDRTRYDDIPLAAIEEIEAPHEGSHRVYLHANGQRYEFRPRSLPAAERMYAAIRGAMS